MGVWQRSPAGLAIALDDPALMAGNRAALPDLRAERRDRLAVLRARLRRRRALRRAGRRWPRRATQLAARGLRLILDYVPNHVAPDHPWLTERPECFVPGTEEDLARAPGRVPAHRRRRSSRNGRDPYFPPWPDVVQLNAFSPALRDGGRARR